MLVTLLALLDLVSAGLLVAGHYGLVRIPLLYVTVYLVAKLFFYRDWLTWIDAAAGVYALFVLFGVHNALTWVFVGFFLYKTLTWLFYTLSG